MTWNAWTITPAVIIAASAAVAFWAWRGRRVDDHNVVVRQGEREWAAGTFVADPA